MRRRLISSATGPKELINRSHYLTFTAKEGGLSISFSTNDCEYYLDDNTQWVPLTAGTPTPSIAAGQKLSFRATGLTATTTKGIGTFSATHKCTASGNVMSMLYGDTADSEYILTQPYNLAFLFQNNTNITDASQLKLPATVLSTYCYANMFNGCSGMISGPTLPAMNLAESCYSRMFQGCSAMVTAPTLPATALVKECYTRIFANCSKLTYIKFMSLVAPSYANTSNWVTNVSSAGTFVMNRSATWDPADFSNDRNLFPKGWTIERA